MKKIFLAILGLVSWATAMTILVLGLILMTSPEILGVWLTTMTDMIALLVFIYFGVIGTDLIRSSYDN